MNKSAIVVAGGKGTRMGGALPKQFLEIGGKPILMHTLEVFFRVDSAIHLIVVLPEEEVSFWQKLVILHDFAIPHQVIVGGSSRFQSVRNGLHAIPFEDGLVAIHDGVRPLVTEQVISKSFELAKEAGSAIPVIALKDSIRELDASGKSKFRDRQHYRLVQTPQTFQLKKIQQAFLVTESDQFTDDATVYENQGWQVTLFEGNPDNIKITTPEDLEFASFLMEKKSSR